MYGPCDDQEDHGLDFKQFDMLIRKIDRDKILYGRKRTIEQEQQDLQAGFMPEGAGQIRGKLRDSRSPTSSPADKWSSKHQRDSQNDFLKVYQSGMDFNEDYEEYHPPKGYLLYEPEDRLKRYEQSRLIANDHIFLNEEQIIKNNI